MRAFAPMDDCCHLSCMWKWTNCQEPRLYHQSKGMESSKPMAKDSIRNTFHYLGECSFSFPFESHVFGELPTKMIR